MGIKDNNGKGFDIDDIDNELSNNPLILMTELRKLLAAKLAGHNNVYNSVKSILNKLLLIKEIDQTKYNKILNKYF